LTVKSASVLQEAIALARASWLGHHPDSFIYTSRDGFVPAASVGAAYRREVFDQIGYFDERFDACEDVEFNHRADKVGLKCFLASEARVNYHPRGTLSGLFRQLARYGRGRVRLARKHPGTFSWRSQAPAVLIVLWLLFGAFALIQPWAGILWLVLTSAYLATVMLTSVGIALRQRAGWRAIFWIACVFVVIHAAAGIGLLQEWVTGTRHWGHSTIDAFPSEKCSA
jgi:succinoglycan biosynthesis protein ExoA